MKKTQLFYGWKIVATFIFMMMIVGFSLYDLPLFYNWWVRISAGSALTFSLAIPSAE
jgi:hypothetical protein